MKCGKVKNPCKICLESVSNKNGLQCKGACKKWAHFKCLNYTPGKISDIKAGLIKVTCPCPDCTAEPKEILMKPTLTCTNEECPATKPPMCEVPDCPNKQNPIPSFPPSIPTEVPQEESPNQMSPKCITPMPKVPECPTPPRQSSCPTSPRNASPPRQTSPPRKSCPPSSNKATLPKCPPSPPSGKTARATCPSCPKHCPKISPQRSQSCSLESPASFNSGKSHTGMARSCSSDSALLNQQDQKMLCSAIEQMCDTVGQLSSQLKDFMCKMMNTFQKNKQK